MLMILFEIHPQIHIHTYVNTLMRLSIYLPIKVFLQTNACHVKYYLLSTLGIISSIKYVILVHHQKVIQNTVFVCCCFGTEVFLSLSEYEKGYQQTNPNKTYTLPWGGYYEINPFVIKSACRSSIFGGPFMVVPSVLRLAVYFGKEESAKDCLDVDLIFFFEYLCEFRNRIKSYICLI